MEPTQAVPVYSSLVEVVRHQAAVRPNHIALIFLPDGETEVGRLTYGELDRRARAFAARLQAKGIAGQRVLLMMPSSVYYLVAFLGSLYARAVPVPVYPPTSSMHAERVAQIVRDCDAKGLILTTSSKSDSIRAKLEQFFPEGLACQFLSIDETVEVNEDDWVEPVLSLDELAFLQYTSGSTSQPRGVMITHGNLLAYCRCWQAATRQDHTDVSVSWLPLFHDMGLIGSVIQPLYMGATIVLMPPLAFLQKPLRWLAAIDRYRGTTSFAPNFAYELCAATLDEVHRKKLDLSSWTVAANAAEPVHADTLARFAKRFASSGFRPEAMNPCYGLAEATLTVVQRARLEAPYIFEADAEALKTGRLMPAQPGQTRTRPVVSCGRQWLDVDVMTVHPVARRACEEGEVGEVWIQGPTIAAGYWQRPEQTAQTFGGYLENGAGPYLRTGDLGVFHKGELFITGRIKDVIIIRGQNHYPQDIEHTVGRAHPALEIGHGAAFSVVVGNEERLVVVQEVRRSQRKKFDGVEVVEAIRAAIAEHHGLALHAVLLLNPATVHITSSGKIQRSACRQDYREGRFEPLHAWSEEAPSHAKPGMAWQAAAQGAGAGSEAMFRAVSDWLADTIKARKNLSKSQVDAARSFRSYGLDSVEIVALSGELSAWLKRAVDPTLMYDYPTIERLAAQLAGFERQVRSERQTDAEVNGEIAIVGMACRFPGAPSVEQFWRLLESGGNAITEVPASRWSADAYFDAEGASPGRMNTRWGGFIDDVDAFDAAFFGIAPREAESMDPQQRLLLETTWHALEDAGIAPDSLAGSKTGVFIGICSNDYRQLQLAHGAGTDAYCGTGNGYSIAANRISYFLDLHGPSWAVDTACSSSLVALHHARTSLRKGECDLAIVGGVNLVLSPDNTIVFSQAQMMSSTGQCKTFDESADGYVRGEGCGVVVLKRHEDAKNDRDRIQALLPGSAVNQDGRSNGLTAPNGIAQQAVIREALRDAGVEPQQVGYVEAHGTGTKLGDPIEVNALKQAYGMPSASVPPMWIGSVKTNIGHLEAAAGIAGVIKTVLVLKHRKIPPVLHLKQLNPLISFEQSRIAVPVSLHPWETVENRPRLASVSSFGFGGTNAHVIVQEAPDEALDAALSVAEPSCQVLTISAKSTEALRDLAVRYAEFLGEQPPPARFSDICYAAHEGRSHHAHRLALVADSASEAASMLSCFAHEGQARQTFSAASSNDIKRKVAFLCTGQGSQYWRMAQGLYQHHAGFRAILDRCDAALKKIGIDATLVSLLYSDADRSMEVDQTINSQPALFAIEYALASLWRSAGVQPDFLIGHSLGEYVAACLAGVFSLEDGLKLVAARGRLMQQLTRPGAMISVCGPEPLVQSLLNAFKLEHPAQCAIAAHNSPEDAVLSGDEAELIKWLDCWSGQDIVITPLRVDRAFHSPLMNSMLEPFERVANEITYALPVIPVVSNISGHVAGTEIATPGYWVHHVMAPVRFSDGLQALAEAECSIFVEVGPHPVLTTFGKKLMPDALWLHSLRRHREDQSELLENLARWYVHGGSLNWNQWSTTQLGIACPPPKSITLPLYEFRKTRHWFTATTGHSPNPGAYALQSGLLGRRVEIAADGLRCHEVMLPASAEFLRDHCIHGKGIMPAAGYVSLALCAAVQEQPLTADMSVRALDVEFVHGLAFTEKDARVQTVLQRDGAGSRVSISSWVDALKRWEVHSTAVLPERVAGSCSPESLLSDGPYLKLDVEAFYRMCFERGLQYGVHFRAIRTLERGPTSVVATVALHSGAPELKGALHPVLLDAAFQTVVVLLDGLGIAADKTPIPSGIQEVVLHGRPVNEMRVVARLRDASANRLVADLVLQGADDAVIVELCGLTCALVDTQTTVGNEVGHEAQTTHFYQPEWIPVPLENPQVAAARQATSALFVYAENASPLVHAMAEALPSVERCDIVLAAQTSQRSEGAWNLDVADPVAISRILGQLPAFDTVYFLGGICDPNLTLNEDALLLAQEHGVVTLFRLLKALGRSEYRDAPLTIKCVTNGVLPVPGRDLLLPFGGSLVGMMKTAEKEYPEWSLHQVDIDAFDVQRNPEELRAIGAAIASSTLHGNALHAGRWFRRVATPLPLTRAPDLPFRDRGVYLIVGGAKGIGYSLACHLAERVQAKLILIGRSPMSSQLREKIAAIEALGGEALYLQADMANAANMHAAVSEAKARFGTLNGVFHSALVLKDSLIDNMSESALREVLAPKASGSLNLFKAVEKEPLDFFLLFSSVVSLLGNAGQANYVAANAFQDAFTHAVSQHSAYPVKVINWGYWGDVGAVANDEYRKRLALQGFGSIGVEEGMNAIHAVLRAEASQVVFMVGDSRVGQALTVPHSKGMGEPSMAMLPKSALMPLADVLSLPVEEASSEIRRGLAHLLGATLRLDIQSMCMDNASLDDVRLSSLGIDSIMAMELRSRLQKWVNVDVPMHTFIGGARLADIVQLVHQKVLLSQMQVNVLDISEGERGEMEVFEL